MKIGLLRDIHTWEVKEIRKELEKRSIDHEVIDSRKLAMDSNMQREDFPYNVIIERIQSHESSLHYLDWFKRLGIPTVNALEVAALCGDKIFTSNLLKQANIPQPRYAISTSKDTLMELMESFGYPVIIKPVTGSHATLIGRVSDEYAAEMVIEHKEKLGSFHHKIFYIQEYIPKPNNRDIRAFVVDGKVIAAIYRTSSHWQTNTARGAVATNCPITPELEEICVRTANVIGEGVFGMDVFESDRGLLMNEVNYNVEFRNSGEPTGVNIQSKIVDYVIKVGENAKT